MYIIDCKHNSVWQNNINNKKHIYHIRRCVQWLRGERDFMGFGPAKRHHVFPSLLGWLDDVGCKIKCTVIKYGREGVPGGLISRKCCVNNTASCRLSVLFGREPWDIGLAISFPGNERGKNTPCWTRGGIARTSNCQESAAFSVAKVAPLVCQTKSQVDVKYTRKKSNNRF